MEECRQCSRGTEDTHKTPGKPALTDPSLAGRHSLASLCCGLGDPFQFKREVPRRLPALFDVLRQAAADGLIECGWGHRLEAAYGRRLFFEDGGGHTELTLALKGALARQHLVQNSPERKHITSA